MKHKKIFPNIREDSQKMEIIENSTSSLNHDNPTRKTMTMQEISINTGLTIFLLEVLNDMYDEKHQSLQANPSLMNVVFPNPNVRAINKELVSSINANLPKRLTTDIAVKRFLSQKEAELRGTKIRMIGTDDQYEAMLIRDRDYHMIWDLVGYAKTEANYFVYVYYTGPTDKGPDNAALKKSENWQIVPVSHLSYFHRRIKVLDSYLRHNSNDQRAISDSKPVPAYDPRHIIFKWRKKKATENQMQIIHDYMKPLFRSRIDPLVAHYKKQKIDVAKDKEEQAKRGFAIIGDPAFCEMSLVQHADLSRFPINRDITFNLDDLVYLAKRMHSSDTDSIVVTEWDPMVMLRALIIATNHELQIRRTESLVADRHLQILEKDDIIPVLENMKNSPEAIEYIKSSQLELIYSLMATDLLSRGAPQKLVDKLTDANENDLEMLTY